jgi:cytochrome c
VDRIDKGLGPSLAQIADAYREDPAKLMEFLRGKAEPRLYPDKYQLMKAQLPRVMSLSDDALHTLADFVLEH